jgi:anthranilate phosphoribosyltransferase
LNEASATSLKGGDTACNAQIALEILRGSAGAARDIVLANAAAGLLAAGLAADLISGVELAARSVDSGAALQKLGLLKENFPAG